jgi:hypothetical protein
VLSRINWEHGHCYPSYARLEKDTGYGCRHLMRCLKSLRNAGLIMIQVRFTAFGDRDSNAYTVPVLV